MFARPQSLLRAALVAFFAAGLAQPMQAQDIESFEFEIETIDGKKLTQDDVMDKVVLIDFWGTWCPPCRRAIPHLLELYEEYKDQGFVIIGLNYEKGNDDAAKLQKVRDYAERADITYPLALGTEEIKAQVPNFRGYPTLLRFGRGMSYEGMHVGLSDSDKDDLDAWVAEAVKKKASKKPAKPASLNKNFDLLDGKKLAIGDGTTSILLVLVHPGMPLAKESLERLRKDAAANKARVVLTSREDLPFKGAELQLKKADLVAMRMGKAFPAFALYDKTGRRVLRDAGTSPKILDAVSKRLVEIAQSKKAKVDQKAGDAKKAADDKAKKKIDQEAAKAKDAIKKAAAEAKRAIDEGAGRKGSGEAKKAIEKSAKDAKKLVEKSAAESKKAIDDKREPEATKKAAGKRSKSEKRGS